MTWIKVTQTYSRLINRVISITQKQMKYLEKKLSNNWKVK